MKGYLGGAGLVVAAVVAVMSSGGSYRFKTEGDYVVVAVNFTPVPREDYRLGVPNPGFYREILNSDSEEYGGSNQGNAGGVHAEGTAWMGRDHSVVLTLPPLAAVVLRPE